MAFMVELQPEGSEKSSLLHVVEEDDFYGVPDAKTGQILVIRDGFFHEPKSMGNVYAIPIEPTSDDLESELTDENRVASIPAGWHYEQEVQIPSQPVGSFVCGTLIFRHYVDPNISPSDPPPYAGN